MRNREDSSGPDLIAGVRAIEEAMKGRRRVLRLIVAKAPTHAGRHQQPREQLQQVIAAAERAGIPVAHKDRRDLDRAAGDLPHQGVIAEIEPFPYLDLDDLIERSSAGGRMPVIALLDGVTDPRNLGAVVRSADGAGLSGVVITRHRCAPMSVIACKAAAGAEEHLPIAMVTNLGAAIDRLKEAGFWVFGAAADEGAQGLWDAPLQGKVALVLGSEGKGLSRLVSERCDGLISIPMEGRVASLNISVAAALLFYEARRRLSQGSQ